MLHEIIICTIPTHLDWYAYVSNDVPVNKASRTERQTHGKVMKKYETRAEYHVPTVNGLPHENSQM
jgi:hypothetical protein